MDILFTLLAFLTGYFGFSIFFFRMERLRYAEVFSIDAATKITYLVLIILTVTSGIFLSLAAKGNFPFDYEQTFLAQEFTGNILYVLLSAAILAMGNVFVIRKIIERWG